MEISPEVIVAGAAIILSLLFSYIPGLRVWYGGKSEEFKKLFMLGLLVVFSGSLFGLGCAGLLSVSLPCSKDGAVQLIWYLGIAVATNQGAYLISPTTSDVKIAKFERDVEFPVG